VREAPRRLAALPKAVWWELARAFKKRRARPGSTFYRPRQPARELYFLEEGMVRLVAEDPSGREVTVAVVEAGGVFGEASLIPADRYGHAAVALTPATVFHLPAAVVTALMHESRELSELMARLLLERRHRGDAWLVATRRSRPREKLARLLLELARETEEGMVVAMGHRELAAILGLARETVSRLLARMYHEGLVETAFRRVILRDPAGLEELLR